MAEAFTPRFVDLVRNNMTTVGTGNFALGSAATGFTGFAEAIQPGESFYYSAIGVDRPNEREVGRGTMQADGTISRQAISGTLTNFTSGTKTIALIAAAEWFETIQAGGSSGGGSASVGAVGELSAAEHNLAGDGISDDGAGLAAADAAAASASKVLVIPAGSYAVATALTFECQVRFAPGARLRPAAGVNVHFSEGYTADDWTHCFDISAGGAVTGDKAPTGYVTPQHFGADPTDPLIDDRPAIEAATEYATLDAIRQEYAVGYPVKFPYPGTGNYYVTRTRPIYIARTTRWFSDVRAFGRDIPGTEIRGADGLDAVAVCFAPGTAGGTSEYEPSNEPGDATPGIGKAFGGSRSAFENLGFLPEPGATVRQGFVHNATAYFRYCAANDFAECGFHAIANASGGIQNLICHPGAGSSGTIEYDGGSPVAGNANFSSYEHCTASDNLLHGFVAHGSVAGTVRYYNSDAQGNKGTGFLENTPVGCQIISCHTAQNSYKVAHGGLFYLPVKHHVASAGNEPGAGADWRDFWVECAATTADAAWAPGVEFHPSGGINVCDATSQTTIVGHYSEGGIEGGVIGRNSTTVLGDWGSVRAPWHGEFRGCRVVGAGGAGKSVVGYAGRTSPDDAASEYGMQLGTTDGYTGGRILQFGDGRDDVSNKASAVRFCWNVGRGRYEFQDSRNASRPIHGISGTGFAGAGYGSIAQRYFFANGMYLGNGTATGNVVARLRSVENAGAITDADHGAAVVGDLWLYASPLKGDSIGARCTTAGTIGSTAVIEQLYPSPVKISVGAAAPSNPSPNDIWVDTN